MTSEEPAQVRGSADDDQPDGASAGRTPGIDPRGTAGTGPTLTTTLAAPQPADFADVRTTNLAVVLRQVRAHGPCSRADIAAATGLNKATVSSLVTDLLERRLLRETGLTEHRIGRPATMLVLDGAYAALGMEINADQVTAVALDLAGERLLSWRRSLPGPGVTPGKTVAAVAALARRALTRITRDGRRVLGVTVGVPGLVDPEGVVQLAPSLGWRDLDLRSQLVRALPADQTFPVSVDNDANLAATAEFRWGAYAGTGNLSYLAGHAGVGAGVVADGRLLRGARGLAGEIGHLPLDPTGPPCGCGGRGCLEAVAGLAALLRRADPESLADGVPGDWEPEVAELVRRAEAADPAVLAALTEVGGWLGQAAAVLAHLVDPEVIMFGGCYAPLAPWLLPAARERLGQRALGPLVTGVRLVAGTLGQDAAAVGAATALLTAVDAGQLPPFPEPRAA